MVDEITKGVAAEIAKQLPSVEEAEPTLESVSKALAEAKDADGAERDERLAKVEADIAKLGAGGSAQNDEDQKDEPLEKAAIAKAYEDEGLDPALKELF